MLAALVAACPALALAAPGKLRDGAFHGRTSEHRAMRMTVVASGRRVTFTIPWNRISGSHCRPRGAFVNASYVFDHRSGARIRRGAFREGIVASRQASGGLVLHYAVTVSGLFARGGRRASGSVSIHVRFTRRGHAGTLARCARHLTFSAHRA